MALTKVTKSGITDNSVDADKIENSTVAAADIKDGEIGATQLASTLDLSSNTITLPNTSVTDAQLAGSIANSKLANSSITVNGDAVSLGGSVQTKEIDWQSVVTGDTTMVAGRGYFVDTSSSEVSMTLPSSASAGDTVAMKDYAATFGSNKLTIVRNGHNIQGKAKNGEITTNRASIKMVYVDSTKGWLFIDESNVGDLRQAVHTEATGGTVTTSGDYKIHTFTGDGCFVVSQVGNNPALPSNPLAGPNTVSYMVVAGGGSGAGGETGGGGGGGGFREGRDIGPSYTASPLVAPGLTITATTYPVTVGAGGPGPGNGTSGNGSNSIFSTITSSGGGGGANSTAGTGGSGGGGGRNAPGAGASGNTPPVSPPQGNSGGNRYPYGSPGGVPNSAGGGGGGTGGGSGGTSGSGGSGGAGATTHITGSPVAYSGGGGGGGEVASGGSGGSGGGAAGKGVGCGQTGNAGSANTGGGGGGTGWGSGSPGSGSPAGPGGAGGKGIVVIRYKYQ